MLLVAAGVGAVVLGAAFLNRPSGPDTAGPSDIVERVSLDGTPPAADARFPWEIDPPPASSVPLDQIRSGGPPPDGIPPIDDPAFENVDGADDWLEDREPVMALVHEGQARAYPLQIMTWHEIVNDRIAGDPITVTYCPLCNSGIAFDRRVETTAEAREMLGVDEAVLDFGTSGRLYRSNLVAYDRQTKSLWIQFTGEAVAGPFLGTDLRNVPVQTVAWAEFKRAHPEGLVLSRETGHARSYGDNPYPGYDDISATPFLYDGPDDDRLAPMARVVTVHVGDRSVAYPLADLEQRGAGSSAVIADEVSGTDLVVFYTPGTASALDTGAISEGRDVGATGVFDPTVDGRRLTFEARDGGFVDTGTGSVWNLLGEATGGPLAGKRLSSIVHDDTFWFVWAAFRPETTIWNG